MKADTETLRDSLLSIKQFLSAKLEFKLETGTVTVGRFSSIVGDIAFDKSNKYGH